ncbi:hypothetical protein C8R44DRAFT_981716 [Mycena epipterygia]|nr:hypothetical protein C8R44DRAFT_981716 [Mycena epipterygia]
MASIDVLAQSPAIPSISLRNKLLLNSISPQQQLQYQQAAPRNRNTYVSSLPPVLPVFPVARPPSSLSSLSTVYMSADIRNTRLTVALPFMVNGPQTDLDHVGCFAMITSVPRSSLHPRFNLDRCRIAFRSL